MRKYWYRRWLSILLLLVVIVGGGFVIQERAEKTEQREVSTEAVSGKLLIPGGMPVGIYMETDGVMVLGTEKIRGVDGLNYEPADKVIRAGDYITEMNGIEINNKKELLRQVSNLTADDVVIQIRRQNELIDVKLKPVQCDVEEYKLGIWVRDNTQGLGTITFLDEKSRYGALGHGIHDVDTNKLLNLSKGRLYGTSIRAIQKGRDGVPGGMEGIIIYNNYNILGSITKNTEAGIYGRLDKIDGLFDSSEAMEAASAEEIEKGPATIRCAASGVVREYEIRITKIDVHEKEINKGIEIEITDQELLELTGGIVQGMSGSPIIQNGKIVGAVTHVFVQNAKKGYGIFIENMLKNVE